MSKKKQLKPALALLALLAAPAPGPADPRASAPPAAARAPLELTFLGNEGFLLASGGRKVLVDALVATTHRQYVWQGAELRADLAAARPPFDGVHLVLASHFHGDHFDPVAVARHLAASPGARFVSTPDAVGRLRREAEDFAAIASRVEAVHPSAGEVRRFPELGLEVYRLHHGHDRPQLQNLGFVVDVGGWRVGAVGDTEASAAEFAAAGFPADLDVALFAAWLFEPGDWPGLVGETVGARVWVPTHRASGENAAAFAAGGPLAAWAEDFGRRFPDGLIFTRLLEKRTVEAPGRRAGGGSSGASGGGR